MKEKTKLFISQVMDESNYGKWSLMKNYRSIIYHVSVKDLGTTVEEQ